MFKERLLMRALRAYCGEHVLRRVLKQGGAALSLGGETASLTVLFLDITGFTKVADKVEPVDQIRLMNEYFAAVVRCVQSTGGVVDKFVGDSIMAAWGVDGDARHPEHACLCALRCLTSAESLCGWREKGLGGPALSVGINTGPVLIGNFGARERMTYTVAGDHVNIAARLEAANRHYHTRILASGWTAGALPESIVRRPVDLVRVPGRREPVEVLEVVGMAAEVPEPRRKMLARYGEGMDRYRHRRFAEAEVAFRAALDLCPDDRPSAIYVERCSLFQKSPPADDWDGVNVVKAN